MAYMIYVVQSSADGKRKKWYTYEDVERVPECHGPIKKGFAGYSSVSFKEAEDQLAQCFAAKS